MTLSMCFGKVHVLALMLVGLSFASARDIDRPQQQRSSKIGLLSCSKCVPPEKTVDTTT